MTPEQAAFYLAWYDYLTSLVKDDAVWVEIIERDGSMRRQLATTYRASGELIIVADMRELDRRWDEAHKADEIERRDTNTAPATPSQALEYVPSEIARLDDDDDGDDDDGPDDSDYYERSRNPGRFE